MLRFFWNLCKLQTSTNCGSNLANLLIRLSLVTQFLNFREENNTFSVSQPRNSESLNSFADSFPFFGLPRKRVHLRPSCVFFLCLPYNDCAILTANCAVLLKAAPPYPAPSLPTLGPKKKLWGSDLKIVLS